MLEARAALDRFVAAIAACGCRQGRRFRLPWRRAGAIVPPMGRLIIQDFVSADGFAADANGEFTIYEHLEGSLDEFNASQLAWLDGIETMVLGTNTYRLFAAFRPQATAEEDIIAPVLNGLRRHVFSTTLESAPWGDDEPAVLESGDAVEAIRRIKGESAGDVILWGSLRLGRSFLAADEVDEVRLIVLPVALGEGVGVFPAGRPPHVMRLVSAQTYDDGVVELVSTCGAPRAQGRADRAAGNVPDRYRVGVAVAPSPLKGQA